MVQLADEGSSRDLPSAALTVAENAARRARATAQIRRIFIRRINSDGAPPPLARMLRGGRGGQVRLKLYLTYIWMQIDLEEAIPLSYPAQSFARLFNLPKPESAGARRIYDAQAWLEENKFIKLEARRGRPTFVHLLSEAGNGETYVPAGRSARELAGTPAAAAHHYIQVPREFWTNGYMAMLSGAALAMYLVLLDQLGIGGSRTTAWISPRIASELYALSEDTRSKGFRELKDIGILEISRRPVEPTDFVSERMRNFYKIFPKVIEQERANLSHREGREESGRYREE